MLEPKFALKRPKSEVPTRIVVRIYYGGKTPFKYYLPISVLSSDWNNTEKKVKRKNKDATMINNYLNKVKTLVHDYSVKMLNDRMPYSKDSLKSLFENFTNNRTQKKKITLIEYIDFFIEQRKNILSDGRKKRYNTFKSHFLNFCDHQNYEYNFNDINYDFYHSFINYFYEVKKQSPNTVSGTIAMMKKIMKESLKQKIHSNRDFEFFEKPSSEVTRVFLNSHEIEKIYNTPIEKNYLQKTKDIFIFGCLTGLRYSDFSNIKPHNIFQDDGIHYLRKVTQKTKKEVIVPIKKIAMEILEKYNYDIPVISNQKLNSYIKELCQICGIDEEILKPIYQGRNAEPVIKKKYELISSHTARRSFATNAYLANVPTIFIMQMTGHTTESSFMKYICITQKESAKIISKHDFFKN